MTEILFVIGPQRTGTTWIYRLLAGQSSGLYIDRVVKENEYFFKENDANKFTKRLSGSGDVKLYADVCSLYFGHINCVKNILTAFPHAKFIVIKRNEDERLESFKEHKNFNNYSSMILGYRISDELYQKQSNFDEFLLSLREIASTDKVLVLDFEELERNEFAWVEKISKFSDYDLTPLKLGVVNESRRGSSFIKRLAFVPIRILQHFKIHLLLRKLKLFLKGS